MRPTTDRTRHPEKPGIAPRVMASAPPLPVPRPGASRSTSRRDDPAKASLPQQTEPSHGAVLKVNKSIQVAASRTDAFTLFTNNIAQWWPPGPHTQPGPTACIEPFVGGRWFETAVDKTEHVWGHVLALSPGHGVTLSWKIGADGEFDSGLQTEVEVLFRTVSSRTASVSLEHRHLERYGGKAKAQRSELGSRAGWIGILEHFALHCAAVSLAHRTRTIAALRRA